MGTKSVKCPLMSSSHIFDLLRCVLMVERATSGQVWRGEGEEHLPGEQKAEGEIQHWEQWKREKGALPTMAGSPSTDVPDAGGEAPK